MASVMYYVLTMQLFLFTTDYVEGKFLNLWIVEIIGGEDVAKMIARDLGFIYKGQALPFEDHYELERDGHPEVSSQHSYHIAQILLDLDQVNFAEQQWILNRSPRGNIPQTQGDKDNIESSKPNSIESIPTNQCDESALRSYSGTTKHGNLSSILNSSYANMFNDPLWSAQWYVQDYRKSFTPVLNLNVVPLYQKGITGKGVTVMIVDDGINEDHDDLKENILAGLNYDFCNNKPGCVPVTINNRTYGHGTKCAGAVAMVANNQVCGVGIAYDARIAGAKVYCPESTSYLESRGLCHQVNEVDIYSNSWGPQDDGMTMDDIGSLSAKAINKGLREGRNGKGAIYIFAAGNGRQFNDNCATDDSINFIGTIPITSASQTGKRTAYAERCTAIFATAYSGDRGDAEYIASSEVYGGCTTGFGGTSAAAPLASGIIALILQVNPELTYRDVMHLLAMTSEVAPLADNGDIWYKNGRGFWVSLEFGFGLINAENMANMAENWQTVPEKLVCKIPIELKSKKGMKFETSQILEMRTNVKGCKVLFLEEIEVTSTVKYPYRGALKMWITSPAGTHSTLLEPRLQDNSTKGLCHWSIKSVHNWGEDPRGEWIIKMKALSVPNVRHAVGILQQLSLTLHGTHEMPAHYKSPRTYSAFRLYDGTTPWTK